MTQALYQGNVGMKKSRKQLFNVKLMENIIDEKFQYDKMQNKIIAKSLSIYG